MMRSMFTLGAKARRTALAVESLEPRDVPTATPYLIPTHTAVSTTAIITAGDTVGTYQMAGTPDGLGAFDNGDGTFTVLMNHEFTDAEGVAHTHNASLGAAGRGSFVDRLVIRKSDLAVLSGGDLIQTVIGPDGTPYPAGSALLNISRFCSADLPAVTAFYNPATGNGTTARLFMNGEETNTAANPALNAVVGRAFAHVVTGPNAGTSYVLPTFPRSAFENLLANPASGDTTLVMADSDGGIAGQTLNKVLAYVGTKTNTGSEVARAGLLNGTTFQIAVAGVTAESRDFALGASSLVTTGTFTLAAGNGGTTFLRPEDGAWDPNHPNDYYFVTTDRLDTVKDGIGTQVGRSRLWRLHFTDLSNPQAGGTIEAVLDGTEGQNMLDNITVDRQGRVLMQEDTGNAAHNAKVWLYDIASDSLIQLAKHDPARFGDVGVPATPPFTVDEESSGILDVSSIFGPGSYLADVQAHYPNGSVLVEGGQLLLLKTNNVTASFSNGTVTLIGSLDADAIAVTRQGHTLTVTANGKTVGTYDSRDVNTIRVDGGLGDDVVFVAPNVNQSAILLGGLGNDVLAAGGGRSILIGGAGSDLLLGGSDNDLLIGDKYTGTDADLNALFGVWVGGGNYTQRATQAAALLAGKVTGDGATDLLLGGGALDLFVGETSDLILSLPSEWVIRV